MTEEKVHPSDSAAVGGAAGERTGDLREAWQELRAWARTDSATVWLLVAILAVAAFLRLTNVNWDMGTHIHPDERFLTMVSDAMKLPKSLGEFFDSTKSSMSPYNKGYNFFVYGTLPLFIVRVVAEVANTINKAAQLWTVSPGVPVYLIGYDGVHFVGRALSGVFDLGCVFLAFVIGRRLYSKKVGLLAAALYAFAVLPLQQSHFYTVDTFGTFFAMLTFYFSVRVAQGGEPKWADGGWANYLALGASLGASLASRINLAPLAGIALLAAGIRLWDDWRTLDGRRQTTDDGRWTMDDGRRMTDRGRPSAVGGGQDLDSGRPSAVGGRLERAWLGTLIQATLFRLFLMGVVTIVVFRLAQPYAFGGTTLLDFSLAQKFRDNMAQISQLIRGDADSPPGHQWTSRTPFVFPFVNMIVWGLGLPLGLTAWAGWALAALQVLLGLTRIGKRKRRGGEGESGRGGEWERGRVGEAVGEVTASPDQFVTLSPSHLVTLSPGHLVTTSPPAWRAHLLPVAWIGGMFLWQGLQFVQSMRYLLPIYPLLAIMAAWVLWDLVDKAGNRKLEAGSRKLEAGGSARSSSIEHPASSIEHRASSIEHRASSFRYVAYALIAVVTIFTMLWGWGFLAIYRRPLSRITASRWIYANVPPGKVIANEHWDDGLPMRLEGKDGFGNWGYKGLSSSSDGSMQMYWEDTPEKRELLYKWLNETDYLVLSSNRLWGSIPRLPMRYPMSTLYYQLLFEEKLGFKQVGHFTSFPTIFGIEFNDTGAEEAFSVYDHPEVYVFQKTPEYSEALARSYFDPIDLEHTLQMWPKQISAAPTALRFTPEEAERQQAGGTWRGIFDLDGLLNRWPVLSVLAWLLLVELLGIVAFPLAFVVMRSLSDRGYGVSKTLGILLLAWLSWIGPSLKIVPYERWWIALALLALIGASALVLWRRQAGLRAFIRERRSLLLTEEAIFLALFALFLLIRIGNPDLWHPARGGEKPMDFAYLNAVIKSTFFPPYDPWQAGGFMNYYYFGFVIVGTLVKLIGIVPWVAYNLIVPTLFGLTGLGAFAVVYSLVEGDTVTRRHGDTVTRRHGDTVTRRHGDTVTRGDGDTVIGVSEAADAVTQSPGHPVTLSPGHPVTRSPGHLVTRSPGHLVTHSPTPPLSVSPLLGGLAGTFFVTIIGNFGTVKLLVDQFAARGAVQTPSSLPGLSKLIRALDGAIAWLGGKQPLNFPNDWWFWNPSRVIPDTINEFPFFTFTYADLHAHMIALPLTLLALAVAVALVRNADGRRKKEESLASDSTHQPPIVEDNVRELPGGPRPPSLAHEAASGRMDAGHRPAGSSDFARPLTEHSPWRIPLHDLWPILLLGLVIGALRATNTWDFPTYLLVSLVAVMVLEASRRIALPFPPGLDERLGFLFRSAVAVGWRLIILVAVGSLAFDPYTKHYATAYAGLQGWQEKTTALPDYLTVWGFFLALAVIYLLSEWGLQARERQMPRWLDNLLPVVVAVAVVLMGAGWLFKLHVWLVAVPLLTLAVLLALARDIPPARRFALLLLALALAITMGVEVVRQKDDIGRMNTVFKFYMQAWILFGVSAAFGLASWAERAREWSPGVRRLAWGMTAALFLGVMLFPITAAQAKVRDRFSAEASPRGLDGMAYLDKAKYADNNRDLMLADDKAAILWMLENVDGSPVVLEGTTPGYRWGSRYSIYTGLPTIQGWDWHQKQQRSVVPGTEIDRRVMNVREIYDTSDLARAQKLLDHYGVSYIVVGPLEQAYYNAQGLAKFDGLVQQGYLEQVYANKSVKIYQVVGRITPVTSPVPSGVGPRPVPTPTPGAKTPGAAPFNSPPPGPS